MAHRPIPIRYLVFDWFQCSAILAAQCQSVSAGLDVEASGHGSSTSCDLLEVFVSWCLLVHVLGYRLCVLDAKRICCVFDSCASCALVYLVCMFRPMLAFFT